MPTTSNFGWTTPADTDLVKDGAAAIRTLGNGIDTSFLDLKGGTTGQVLSKASNTDLDFTWSSVDPLTILDAKGDLISATAADTPARLASSGVNGDVLTVDTSTSTGLKWAAPSSGANWSLLNAGGTALTGATTVTVSGISAKDKIAVAITGASAGASSVISVRFNGDTGNNYNFGCEPYFGSTVSAGTLVTNYDRIVMGDLSSNASSTLSGFLFIDGANASGLKIGHKAAAGSASGGTGNTGSVSFVNYAGTSTISSVSIVSSTGNLDAGTVYIYTSA